MDAYTGDAVFRKVGDIEQLVFEGSLTLGDVQSCIGLAGAHREKLFFGVLSDKITISLNRAATTVVIDDEDVKFGRKRRRKEDPFEEKIAKSMAALQEKIPDVARVDKTRDLLKALCALKDVSSGTPAVDAFSVFLKAEALVLLKLSFKVGARRFNRFDLFRLLGELFGVFITNLLRNLVLVTVLLSLLLKSFVRLPERSKLLVELCDLGCRIHDSLEKNVHRHGLVDDAHRAARRRGFTLS